MSFFCACLGVFLRSFRGRCPPIKGFISVGSNLGLVLVYLYPILRQSLNWFREMFGEERVASKVRSSELETGVSSGDDPIEVEGDIAALVLSSSHSSRRREIRAFQALKEECTIGEETFTQFRDSFQSPAETRIRLPYEGKKSCSFTPREVCFYKAAFSSSLKFLIHPFIMELLHYLNIASGQLMPNS